MFKGKRILAFVLMVLMLLSLLPAVALAEDDPTAGRTNLVANGDFEDGFSVTVGSTSKNWSVSSTTYGTRGSLSTEKYRSEAQSVKVGDQIKSGTAKGSKWINLQLPVSEFTLGHTYRFVVYSLKGDEASKPAMRIDFKHSDGNTGKYVYQEDGTAESGGWVKHVFDYTVPTTACTSMTIYLYNYIDTDGSFCYFDDFAIYDLDEELYTVTWKNYDGTVLETDTNLAAGITPEYNGATPTRAASGNYVYTFTGWSPEVAAVTGDVTYTAQFTGMNKVTGTDFESGTTGWAVTSGTYGTKGTLSSEKYRGESGQSVKVGDQIKAGTSAGNKWISYSWDVGEGGLTVGNTYRFIVYAMKGDTDSNPKLEARGLNGSKNVGSETTADGTVTSSTDWVVLSVDLKVPTDATKVTAYLRNVSDTDGSYCYFDDFAVYDLSAEAPAEKFELEGATVDLGNSLDMNFYIDPANLDANEDYTAKIVRSYADGTANEVLTVPVDQTKVDTNNGNYIYVTYGNIAAKEMGDEIAVTIYDSEGNAVSETWTDSVKDYAERALVAYQDDAKTVAVLKDLLNYGAAAQAQFEYDAENPVDSDLTDIRSITVTGEATANEAKKGTTLTLKSNILMEMFFFMDKVGDATTATVSYTNHRGTEVTDEVDLVADDYYLDAYKVQIEGLVIADINTVVTVTVGDITVTDTMAWFVERSTDADIYSAILALGDSAYAYFH